MTGDGWLVFPAKLLFMVTFNMLLVDGKSFFRSQKDLKLIYLSASIALELLFVIHFQYQKYTYRVTGDGCLVFPAKLFLYTLSIHCWLVENHFSEVKKTTNSFTYEIQ